MILYILFSVLIVLGIGLGIKYFTDQKTNDYKSITKLEYVWASLIISLLVIPAITTISWNVSKNNQMTYVEHLNGWETKCNLERIRCSRDGPCQNTYQCDPYLVSVSYSCGDSKNPQTCTRLETRYHNCPYAKEEWTYTVSTTLGEYTIDSHRFPTDYATNPWRIGEVASLSLAREVGVGNPDVWEDVRDRLLHDSAGPVTKLHTYENYVLASQMTVLKTSVQNDIAEFQKDKLLPPIKRDIVGHYWMDNVYNVNSPSPAGFRDAAARLASSLGTTRQGDIRIVLTNHPKIHGNPDLYTNTLHAFWQSRELQGNNHALPKNALVVVIGTDGKQVLWSRAFTGMPVGNEALVASFNTRLVGLPYQTDSLIGFLRHRNGANVGLDTLGKMSYLALQSQMAYKRENMGYYSYLRGDIQPTQSAKVWSVIFSILLGGLFWLVPLHMHCSTEEKRKTNLYPWRT